MSMSSQTAQAKASTGVADVLAPVLAAASSPPQRDAMKG